MNKRSSARFGATPLRAPTRLAVAACPGTLTLSPLAIAREPDPVDITAVPTEGDPLDLRGRGPAPKTKDENNRTGGWAIG